jgi:hypothetical protein
MATKTEQEKTGMMPKNDSAISKTDPRMVFQPISDAETIIPDSLFSLLGEGYQTQRHVKLVAGKYLKGIFRGMEDGELSARGNTGEVPAVKWVYVEQENGVIVRLLGAYNLITQLQRAHDGDSVVIARGVDYDLPNGFRCTDYIVLVKPGMERLAATSQGAAPASGATVPVAAKAV